MAHTESLKTNRNLPMTLSLPSIHRGRTMQKKAPKEQRRDPRDLSQKPIDTTDFYDVQDLEAQYERDRGDETR